MPDAVNEGALDVVKYFEGLTRLRAEDGRPKDGPAIGGRSTLAFMLLSGKEGLKSPDGRACINASIC